ncbi:MAG: hypothetical protein LBR28_07145 [Bacteroidales bacterium]|jgi:hypothetical protein|nr:hypothetical protein [Bacteroidales bacterium]
MKIRHNIIILVLILLCGNVVSAQMEYALKYEKQADKAMEANSYWEALNLYNMAQKFVKFNSSIVYKTAKVNLLLLNYVEAEKEFKKLLSEKDSSQIDTLFPDFYFCLAQCAIHNEHFEEATNYINTSLLTCADIQLRKKLKALLLEIAWIKENNQYNENIRIWNLGQNINNSVSQSGGQLIDSMFIFNKVVGKQVTNLNNFLPEKQTTYFEDLNTFVDISFVDENFYTPSSHLNWGKINEDGFETSNMFFDTVENIAYFVRCDNKTTNEGCKIYFSQRNFNGTWSKPKVLDFCNEEKGSYNHPFIAWITGQKIMFFASDRKGGYGQMDIWGINLSIPSALPFNLGNVINTEYNEVTPFYSVASQTLYFASDTRFSFGGFDIFYSKGMGISWEKPVNMLKPINSGANDLYPVIIKENTFGYVTSNRIDSASNSLKSCCNQIYAWEVIQKEEKIDTVSLNSYAKTLQQNFNPAFDLPLALYYHNDQPSMSVNAKSTNFDYKECWIKYSAMKNIYIVYYAEKNDKENEEKMLKFFEEHIDYGMDKLNAMMQYLLEQMQNGYSLDIQIRGYSSALYNENYNFNLSERRINTIENYIKKWNDGLLAPYLEEKAADNKPRLNIIHLPVGKSESTSSNPQSLEEKRQSIYTLEAMAERKIEIKIISQRDSVTK